MRHDQASRRFIDLLNYPMAMENLPAQLELPTEMAEKRYSAPKRGDP